MKVGAFLTRIFTNIYFIYPTLLIGVLLLTINIVGLSKSLRDDRLSEENNTLFETGAAIPPEEAIKNIPQRAKEDDEEYIRRLTDLLHHSIAHYWSTAHFWAPITESEVKDYNYHVPIWENYLLWMAGIIFPSMFKEYKFWNYEKTIERGVGMCGYQALTIVSILSDTSIPARTVGLHGHIVAEVKLNGDYWVIDPDHNVVIPHSISEIQDNPALIHDYVLNSAPIRDRHDTYTLETYEQMYTDENPEYYALEDSIRTSYEQYFYILKWVFPLIFFLPSIVSIVF